ncbi:MAG: cobalamin biosynthesis protein [Candidatus Calescibacterium sp.]
MEIGNFDLTYNFVQKYYLFFVFVFALIFDLFFGEPHRFFHPVVIIGKAVEKLDSLIKRGNKFFEFFGGFLLLVLGICIYLLPYLLIKKALNFFHNSNQIFFFVLVFAFDIFFLKSTFAIKSLKDHAFDVFSALSSNDLVLARKNVGKMVSRDVSNLEKPHIISASVESVAENLVDSIIAPLFFFSVGGIELAIVYRVVNTLDAMVGYKNEKYRFVGFISAKFDDILSFIPARISFAFILIAAFILRKNIKDIIKTFLRFRRATQSPNSYIPITAFSGALKIKLEKINYYSIGDFELPKSENKIKEAIQLMLTSALLFSIFFVIPSKLLLFH